MRWGNALHDRFMLPAFIKADFEGVIDEPQQAGYALDAAWFAPHHEFRFPLIGELALPGMRLTLRHALSPGT